MGVEVASLVASVDVSGNLVEAAERSANALERLEERMSSFGNSGKGAGRGVDKMGKATDRANLALQDLGRIAEDLPYGIRGVANNMSPMIASFQNAKKAAAAAGQSIGKTFLKSLTGPGGVLVAISLLTTALVFFEDEIAEAFGNAKKKAEEFKNAVGEAAGEMLKLREGPSFTVDFDQLSEAITQLEAELPGFESAAKNLGNIAFGKGLAAGLVSENEIKLAGEVASLAEKELGIRRETLAYMKELHNEALGRVEAQKLLQGLGLKPDAEPVTDYTRATEKMYGALYELLPISEGVNHSLRQTKIIAGDTAVKFQDLAVSTQEAIRIAVAGVDGLSYAFGETIAGIITAEEGFKNLRDVAASFGDMVKHVFGRVIADISAAIAKALILKGLMSIFGGASFGAFSGKSFLGIVGNILGVSGRSTAPVSLAASSATFTSAQQSRIVGESVIRGNDLVIVLRETEALSAT